MKAQLIKNGISEEFPNSEVYKDATKLHGNLTRMKTRHGNEDGFLQIYIDAIEENGDCEAIESDLERVLAVSAMWSAVVQPVEKYFVAPEELEIYEKLFTVGVRSLFAVGHGRRFRGELGWHPSFATYFQFFFHFGDDRHEASLHHP